MGLTEPLLVLTIGQAPRLDIVAELADVIVGRPIEVRGALDGLAAVDVEAFPPISPADTLHTRMADGADVVVSKSEITLRLSTLIKDAGDRPILVACTGHFAGLPERAGILYPSDVLRNLVEAVLPVGGRLGVLVPLETQIEPFREQWHATGRAATVVAVTPGHDSTAAATELRESGVEIVVMDCFGYSRSTLQQVRDLTGRPVLSAVRCAAHLANELLG
ncbi:MAG: protein AroM [Candidatus Poriferisodalaceae bacterium]|jgi:protein AroM